MKVKELSHTEIQLREDGIVVIRCKEDHQYEIEDVKEIINATGELVGNKKLPLSPFPVNIQKPAKKH